VEAWQESKIEPSSADGDDDETRTGDTYQLELGLLHTDLECSHSVETFA
jgi:hypothetical protein